MNRKLLWRVPLAALLAAMAIAVGPAAAAVPEENPVPAGKEVVTPSGLKYTDLKVGQGEEARTGQVVEVHYTGWLPDGTEFETSRNCKQPLTFRVGAGDVLKGWDEGVLGMKVGGKRRLVLPPDLGYGKTGAGSVVPPNATLVFEFELLTVRAAAQGKGR
jgi:FKBP-type peptidyl-prolyl cis-trans isomerase